ncbi:MAG: TRAP transporter permease [Rhodospirillaceae bacterium]
MQSSPNLPEPVETAAVHEAPPVEGASGNTDTQNAAAMLPLDEEVGVGRLSGPSLWAAITFGMIGVVLTVNQTFGLLLTVDQDLMPLGNSYLYYIIGLFVAATFLIYPARAADRNRVPLYDWAFGAIAIGVTIYIGVHGLRIIQEGWDLNAPLPVTIAAGVLLVLILEGTRRCAGTALLAVSLFFGCYPLFADYMPGFLWGTEYSLGGTIRAHVLGVESIIGVPMQAVADLVIGYVIFGTTLTVLGGGRFFMSFAVALMGRSRGGPAKVAVLSSGILGSLSGSVISNVLTTGPVTIPTMKRVGYPPHYAGAVEACASTGATLMPPVMGAVAFIMASFLGVPYADIMVAATLPAFLFYLGLLVQVDTFAAKNDLRGMNPAEVPRLLPVLKDGWPYLFSLVMLIFVLLFMRLDSYAPYYTTLVLLLISIFRKKDRITLLRLRQLLLGITRSVASLVAILAGVGLIVGGLSYTGVAGAFSRELLLYAGGSIPLMLIAGAVTSFVLGMGMTVSACYIFLSVLLAPALVLAGLDPMASHLFILYWGMMSYLTPPVALAAITAAGIADANPTRTGFYAMRLGGVLFILPFLFVLNPALILQGPLLGVAHAAVTAIIAVWLIAAAFEGYLYRVGRLGTLARAWVFVSGVALIYPETFSDMVGLGLLASIYVADFLTGGRIGAKVASDARPPAAYQTQGNGGSAS